MAKPREKRAMAKYINNLRRKLNLTQHEFAAKINSLPAEIWRWESARHMPCRMARERIEQLAAKYVFQTFQERCITQKKGGNESE